MEPEWRQDPTGRHQLRWHDGERWTDHVADGQDVGTDQYDGGEASAWPAPSAGDAGSAGGGGFAAGGWEDGRGGGYAPTAEQPRRGVRVGWVVAIAVVTGIVAGGIGLAVGLAIGASSSFLGEIEQGFDEGFDEGFGGVDAEQALDAAVPGEPLELDGAVGGDAGGVGVAHTLVLDAATVVELTVTEGDFDTEMLLFDGDGLVAQDDDGGQDLLSQLTVDLAAGEYQVVVRTLGGFPDDGGAYALQATQG